MYSLTFCIHFLLPERYQWKPAFQTAAVMLRTPPVDGRSPAGRPRPLPICGARFSGNIDNKINTNKLNPGLVASYDLWPGNGVGLFW